MNIKFWGIVIAVGVLAGCNNISPSSNSINNYYSVDSLIELQFTKKHYPVSILKQVQIGEESDTSSVMMDSLALRKELSIFSEIDLNKSDLVGVYDIQKEGNKIIYTKKPSENSGNVTRLEVLENGNVVTVLAESEESNSLFDSKREYLLQFVDGNLDEYIISGSQKIVMKEVSTFAVKGKIVK